jgi:hypothetical protein
MRRRIHACQMEEEEMHHHWRRLLLRPSRRHLGEGGGVGGRGAGGCKERAMFLAEAAVEARVVGGVGQAQ